MARLFVIHEMAKVHRAMGTLSGKSTSNDSTGQSKDLTVSITAGSNNQRAPVVGTIDLSEQGKSLAIPLKPYRSKQLALCVLLSLVVHAGLAATFVNAVRQAPLPLELAKPIQVTLVHQHSEFVGNSESDSKDSTLGHESTQGEVDQGVAQTEISPGSSDIPDYEFESPLAAPVIPEQLTEQNLPLNDAIESTQELMEKDTPKINSKSEVESISELQIEPAERIAQKEKPQPASEIDIALDRRVNDESIQKLNQSSEVNAQLAKAADPIRVDPAPDEQAIAENSRFDEVIDSAEKLAELSYFSEADSAATPLEMSVPQNQLASVLAPELTTLERFEPTATLITEPGYDEEGIQMAARTVELASSQQSVGTASNIAEVVDSAEKLAEISYFAAAESADPTLEKVDPQNQVASVSMPELATLEEFTPVARLISDHAEPAAIEVSPRSEEVMAELFDPGVSWQISKPPSETVLESGNDLDQVSLTWVIDYEALNDVADITPVAPSDPINHPVLVASYDFDQKFELWAPTEQGQERTFTTNTESMPQVSPVKAPTEILDDADQIAGILPSVETYDNVPQIPEVSLSETAEATPVSVQWDTQLASITDFDALIQQLSQPEADTITVDESDTGASVATDKHIASQESEISNNPVESPNTSPLPPKVKPSEVLLAKADTKTDKIKPQVTESNQPASQPQPPEPSQPLQERQTTKKTVATKTALEVPQQTNGKQLAANPLNTQTTSQDNRQRLTNSQQQASLASDSSATKPKYGVKGMSNPAPRYPYKSRARGEQGKVILRVVVNRKGRADEVTVVESSGFSRLDKAATKAVRKWRFQPARNNGLTARGVVQVPISFVLEKS